MAAVLGAFIGLVGVAVGAFITARFQRRTEQTRWERDSRLRVYSAFLHAFNDFMAVAPTLAQIHKEIDQGEDQDEDDDNESDQEWKRFLIQKATEMGKAWGPLNTSYSEVTFLGSEHVRGFADAMFVAAGRAAPWLGAALEEVDPFEGFEFDDRAVVTMKLGYVIQARRDLGLDSKARRWWEVWRIASASRLVSSVSAG